MRCCCLLLGGVVVIAGIAWAIPKLSRPKLYGSAIPPRELDPSFNATKRKILLIHNFFRSRVEPTAADMLEMTWHDEAASDAQRWAESCQLLVHDNLTGRWTDDFGSCGQNIFVANVQVPWFFAAKVWFLEKVNFTYGEDLNDPNVVGHYTQMVWHSTHRVGCGFNYCEADNSTIFPYYSYVCNYCPIGNHPERFDRPYTNGTACSKCEDHCKFNKLCTNGCPYADFWSNCAELNATWSNWLCDDPTTDRYRACRSTCACSGTIR
ncbi:cysteine-rich venom protein LEI1-like [Uloborus diversus]|uniref:cysteine-rich venom protein LEI1-like n=1 Tax=Uloborus diversus TaxID=327109 RepID=UPI002409EBD7|nr:cysteine-rich venom protein LEI1-like [Uloborus diversus]